MTFPENFKIVKCKCCGSQIVIHLSPVQIKKNNNCLEMGKGDEEEIRWADL